MTRGGRWAGRESASTKRSSTVSRESCCFSQDSAIRYRTRKPHFVRPSRSRGQQARSLELRATVSLTRLWQAERRGPEGRDALATTCGWFTEGLDTVDLREARALLEAL